MRKLILTIACLTAAFISVSYAQKQLPEISVRNVNGKIIISWKNGYGATITTLNVQRSADSLRNFSTFTSVLNPSSKENGVVDSKGSPKLFYRVFIVFEGGTYQFSHSYKPVLDTTSMEKEAVSQPNMTLSADTAQKESKKPAAKKVIKSIYPSKENNVIINLPDARQHQYSAIFYNEADEELFRIHITEPYLILDKANFLHAGWFYYQLYDTTAVIEQNNFFIAKDAR